MLPKEEEFKVIDGMLRCIGYQLKPNGLDPIVAQSGINSWIIQGRPSIQNRPKNTVFEFIDEYSEANLNAVVWYEGDILNFVAMNNILHGSDPWYYKLPILQIAYDTSKNTAWFLYRTHCIVGSAGNGEFKANRITTIMEQIDKETLDISDIIQGLSNCFDSELTADVVEREIEKEMGETCGLPDLIRFFRDRKIL